MKNNKKKGNKGEDTAIKFLENKGYIIIKNNYYASRYGEIDIIARDQNTLVFIEVKTRTNNNFGHPFESITPTKLNKMRKAAEFYLQNNQSDTENFRLDAIAIILSPKQEIIHLENI